MIRAEVSDSGLLVRLTSLQETLEDLRPVWPTIHKLFVEFEKHHFQTQGAYVGKAWAPLNPGYAAWKQRTHPGKPMMHLTERLYPSLTRPGHADHVFITGPTFMEVGTRVPYAKAHQYGRPEIRLPARVVVPKPTKNEGKAIVDAVLAFIFKKMRMGRR